MEPPKVKLSCQSPSRSLGQGHILDKESSELLLAASDKMPCYVALSVNSNLHLITNEGTNAAGQTTNFLGWGPSGPHLKNSGDPSQGLGDPNHKYTYMSIQFHYTLRT